MPSRSPPPRWSLHSGAMSPRKPAVLREDSGQNLRDYLIETAARLIDQRGSAGLAAPGGSGMPDSGGAPDRSGAAGGGETAGGAETTGGGERAGGGETAGSGGEAGHGDGRGLPALLTAYLEGEQRLGRIGAAADID